MSEQVDITTVTTPDSVGLIKESYDSLNPMDQKRLAAGLTGASGLFGVMNGAPGGGVVVLERSSDPEIKDMPQRVDDRPTRPDVSTEIPGRSPEAARLLAGYRLYRPRH
jgi:hypothetical protein